MIQPTSDITSEIPAQSSTTDKAEPTVLSHLAGRFTIQTENLATEALAFILRRSPAASDALRAMVGQLGCPYPDGLLFDTQVSANDGSRPDLVARNHQGQIRLLIEAKFWAGLTDNQPVTYLKTSLPESGGLLLFVAPEKRLSTLWSELTHRIDATGWRTEALPLPNKGYHGVRIHSNVLALISWRLLLDKLLAHATVAGDSKTIEDLRQLSGLC